MRTVTMSRNGRITMPAEARQKLGIDDGEAEFEVEVDQESGVVTFRQLVRIPREDAWAYTPGHLRKLARAADDVAAGRVYRLSEGDLRKLAPVDE